jgi:predicted metal-dependent HD superfamily phosphohydrolase
MAQNADNDGTLAEWTASLPETWIDGVDASVLVRARAAYDSPGRYYHTWEHVADCVEHLRGASCENPRVVFLALVFHDAVYVAGRSDNEQLSAQFAHDVLSAEQSIPPRELAEIERLIIVTKDHHARLGLAGRDEATLLDIDLSILAAPRDRYARYAKQIRDEWVPSVTSDTLFRFGRRKFLRGMLAAPHIYLSSSAQQHWDRSARENIAWEIDELR